MTTGGCSKPVTSNQLPASSFQQPASNFTFYVSRLLLLILLLAAWAQVTLAARQTSITLDEPLHIASGYASLLTGDYRLVEEHPPLVKMWQALPLLWAQPSLPDPRTVNGWESSNLINVAQEVVVAYRPIEPLVFAARVPTMLLLILLAALVYRWASELFGRRAGLLALTLTVFDPNLLAHAGVAATDLGATCGIFAAMVAFWRWRTDAGGPSWKRMLLAAVVLGLALGVKSTALLLLPVFGVLLLIRRRGDAPLTRYLRQAAVAAIVAFVVLWSVYRFEVGPLPAVELWGLSIPAGAVTVPMPSHLLPLLRLRDHMSWGHAAFLMGENLHYGDWRYFPIALALKTPPLTLGLLAVVLARGIWHANNKLRITNYELADAQPVTSSFDQREKLPTRAQRAQQPVTSNQQPSNLQPPTSNLTFHASRFPNLPFLLLFPALYFAASLTSSLNIGYRHLLPILPFIHVAITRITNQEHESRMADQQPAVLTAVLRFAQNCHRAFVCAHARRARSNRQPASSFQLPISRFTSHVRCSRFTFHVSRFTFFALLAAYALTTLRLFPWHLAYFNVFAGGPDGGYRYLVDSNLDWGQTWKALGRYLDAEGIREYGLSQYTINDPHAYGLDYTPLPPWPGAPAVLPQRFAPAPGVYAISSTQLQGVVIADAEMFDYFRRIEPRAKIGHAMFVYDIPPAPATGWVAQCSTPVTALPPETLAEGLGRDDLETFSFDCSQSWLIPPGNGWYVMAREAGPLPDVSAARLAYEQTQPGLAPPFAVYEWFDVPSPVATIVSGTVRSAPSDVLPAQAAAEGAQLTTPVPLSNTLAFLGYTLEPAQVAPGETLVLQTYWEVRAIPAQPLSLMAHLLDASGIPVAVGDGLGVPLDQWRSGQIIVQRHRWEIPPQTPPGSYRMQTGAYTFPDMERLPVRGENSVAGDRLLIGTVEVVSP